MRRGDFVASLLLSGAAALWLAAAVATLFAGPQYGRYHVDLEQDPAASTRTGLVLVGGVLVMMVAAGAAIAVAALGALGSPLARGLTRGFAGLAAVVAVVAMVAGVPDGVPWHANLMTGTAVLTLLSVATVVAVQLPARRRTASLAPSPGSPVAENAGEPVEEAAHGGVGAGVWRSARRRDVPRWALVLAAAVALVFAAVAGIQGVRAAGTVAAPSVPVAGPSASAEPPHDVIYTVSAPSTVTWMEIVFVDELGKTERTTSAPSGYPWVRPIRTGPDTRLLYLAVSVSSKEPDTKIQCAIHVDGRRAIASEGPSCNLHVRFP
jgi:hypothetical protein